MVMNGGGGEPRRAESGRGAELTRRGQSLSHSRTFGLSHFFSTGRDGTAPAAPAPRRACRRRPAGHPPPAPCARAGRSTPARGWWPAARWRTRCRGARGTSPRPGNAVLIVPQADQRAGAVPVHRRSGACRRAVDPLAPHPLARRRSTSLPVRPGRISSSTMSCSRFERRAPRTSRRARPFRRGAARSPCAACRCSAAAR
jgi:hypothetical protein